MKQKLPDEMTCMNGQLDDMLRGRKFKKMVRGCFESIRREFDIKQVEVEILLYLHRYPDASASRICSELELNKGHVSRALLNLCEHGFIVSSVNPSDRRRTKYDFLEKGKQFLVEAEAVRTKTLRLMIEGISEEELKITRIVAQKMLRNMEKL